MPRKEKRRNTDLQSSDKLSPDSPEHEERQNKSYKRSKVQKARQSASLKLAAQGESATSNLAAFSVADWEPVPTKKKKKRKRSVIEVENKEAVVASSEPSQPSGSTSFSNILRPAAMKQALKTKGQGNCFFHAVFGEEESGEYCAMNAAQMRQAWVAYLTKFDQEGLRSPKMPEALKDALGKVFQMFLNRPGDLTGEASTIKLLVDLTKALQAVAESKSKRKITELTDSFILQKDDSAFREKWNPVFQGLYEERKETVRTFPTLADDKEHLKNVITTNLREIVVANGELFNRQEYDNEAIARSSFIEEPKVYAAYLKAIASPAYYVFFEEMALLITLAGMQKLTVYYTDQGSQLKIFNRNADLVGEEYKPDAQLWGDKSEEEIYHTQSPPHFSRYGISKAVAAESKVSIDAEKEKVSHQGAMSLPDFFGIDGLRKTAHGNFFQLALLILVAERAARKKAASFSLVSEASEFEKFDDLVVEWADHFTFLQAKHTINLKESYSKSDFCNGTGGDASLAKYFDSWMRLRKKYAKTGQNHFIFFSNRDVTQEVELALENTSLDKDTFLFNDVPGKTKRFNTKLKDSLEPYKNAIKQHSVEIIKSKASLGLDINTTKIDKFYEEVVSKIIEVNQRASKAFTLEEKEVKLVVTRILFLSLLDASKLTEAELSNLRAEQLEDEKQSKNFTLTLSFSDAFIRGEGLAAPAQTIRELLVQRMKPSKKQGSTAEFKWDSFKDWQIKFSSSLLKLKTGVNSLVAEDSKEKDVFLISSKSKQQSQITAGSDELKWQIKNEQDCYLVSSLFGAKLLDFNNINVLNPVQQFVFEQLLKRLNKHYLALLVHKKNGLAIDKAADSNINIFFKEFTLKVAQPNQSWLFELIQKEIGLSTKIGAKALYRHFKDHILQWFVDHKCRLLRGDNFMKFREMSQMEVARHYLLGRTQQYEEECKKLQPAFQTALALEELSKFLKAEDPIAIAGENPKNPNKNKQELKNVYENEGDKNGRNQSVKASPGIAEDSTIAVLSGPADTMKRERVYYAVSKRQYEDSTWAFLESSSPHYQKLTDYLQGESLVLVVVDLANFPKEDSEQTLLLNIFQAVIKTTGKKKLIVLVDEPLEVESQLVSWAKSKKIDTEKMALVQAKNLTNAQIASLSKSSETQYINFAGRYQTVQGALEQKDSGVCMLSKSPKWLASMLLDSRAVSEKERDEAVGGQYDLPYQLYQESDIVVCKPLYDLYSVLKYTACKFFWIQNAPKNIYSTLQTMFDIGGEKPQARVAAGILVEEQEHIKYRVFTDTFEESDYKKTKGKPEKIVFHGAVLPAFLINEALSLKVYSQEGEADICLLVDDNPRSLSLPKPANYIEPTEELERKSSKLDRYALINRFSQSVIHLIACDAGRGKSALFKNLIYEWQKVNNPKHYPWVIRCNLPDLAKFLQRSRLKAEVENKFQQILLRQISLYYPDGIPDWIYVLLKHDIEAGGVKLLLDAWDEVNERDQAVINQFIASIPVNISYDITTRPYAKNALHLSRSPDSYLILKPFDDGQLIAYIQSFFEAALDKKLSKEIGEILLQGILTRVGKGALQHSLREFIGVPLQTYLLCEGLLPRVKAWQKKGEVEEEISGLWREIESLTMVKLYELFTFSKLLIFLERQFKIPVATTQDQPHRAYVLSAVYTDFLIAKAYQQLFDKDKGFLDNQLSGTQYTPEILSELEKTGFVSQTSKEQLVNVRFIHKTYEEYFTAIFILRQLLLSPSSEVRKAIIRDVSAGRYLQKYHVVFSFAAQLSMTENRLIPGWLPEEHAVRFWETLFVEPVDHLGRAESQLLQSCLESLTPNQREWLVTLLPEKLSARVQRVQISPATKILVKRHKESTSQKEIGKQFAFQVNPPKIEEKSLQRQSSCLIIAELKDKGQVVEVVKSHLKKGSLEAKQLAISLITTTKEKDLNHYWDIDGGFEAMALLGNHFNLSHAIYFSERILGDPSWRLDPVFSAMQGLLASAEFTVIQEPFLKVLITVASINPGRALSLLHLADTTACMARVVDVFINQQALLGGLNRNSQLSEIANEAAYFPNIEALATMFNSVSIETITREITKLVNQSITNILRVIFYLAYESSYAVIFNGGLLLIIAERCTYSLVITNLKFEQSTRAFLASLQPEKASELFLTSNYKRQESSIDFVYECEIAPLVINYIVKNKKQEVVLDKDNVRANYEYLSKIGFLEKYWITLLSNTAAQMDGYWPLDGGIEAVKYCAYYFDESFSKFLVDRATLWPNNKEKATQVLRDIRIALLPFTKKPYKSIDECILVAMKAYNSCIQNDIFKGDGLHALLPPQIGDAQSISHLISAIATQSGSHPYLRRVVSAPASFKDFTVKKSPL